MNTPNRQNTPEQKLFERIEASFAEIAERYPKGHRQLLALNITAKYHGVPAGVFKKAFSLWLEERGGQG